MSLGLACDLISISGGTRDKAKYMDESRKLGLVERALLER